jgi:hypothetical protein
VALTPASPSTGITFTWTKDGVIVGSNSTTYAYTGQATDVGPGLIIVCTAVHATGAAVSTAATLTVQVRCPRLEALETGRLRPGAGGVECARLQVAKLLNSPVRPFGSFSAPPPSLAHTYFRLDCSAQWGRTRVVHPVPAAPAARTVRHPA